MNDSQMYNAFGLVTIQKKLVMVTLTMVKNGNSFTRTIKDETVKIDEVKPRETIAITLGIMIQKETAHITAHEIGTEGQEGLMVEIPQVSEAINKVIGMMKIAADI